MAGCVFVASLFILDHIGLRAFWLDEAATANIVSNSFSNLYLNAINDSEPLFYSYTIKGWSVMFGNGETALRSFSAMFGILAIILVYKAGRYLFGNEKTGILAAAMMAANYFLIWYSALARMYTLSMFLGLLSFYFFIGSIKENKKSTYLGYILASTAGIYTHPWFAFILFSQFLSVIIFAKKITHFKKSAVSVLSVIFFSIPSFLISLRYSGLGVGSWIGKVGWRAPFESIGYLTLGSFWVYLLVSAAVFIYLTVSKKTSFPHQSLSVEKYILRLYLLAPIFTALAISQFSPIYKTGRYELIILPAFILLFAGFWSKINNRAVLTLVAIVLFGFTARQVAADRANIEAVMTDDRTESAILLKDISDNDTIVATDLNWATFNYYLNRQNSANKIFDFIPFPEEMKKHPGWKNVSAMLSRKQDYEREADNLVVELLKKKQKIWVIYLKDNPINDLLMERLNKNMKYLGQLLPGLPRENGWFDSIEIYATP